MIKPTLVVLDLDGTLVRLAVDWAAVRAAIAAELVARGHRSAGGVLATLRALDAAGEHDAAYACRAIAAHAERQAAADAQVNRALLRWLQVETPRARLGVLTLNDRRAALDAIESLGLGERLRPEDVIGRDDAPPKPSPDGLVSLMARHGVTAAQALLIGDSEADLQCARAVGVAAIDVAEIGVEWGAPTPTTG